MDHHDIIEALGGPHALGASLRERGVIVANVTVRSWLLEGRSIPAKYWTHVAEIGSARGVEVSFERLAAAASVSNPRPSVSQSAAA